MNIVNSVKIAKDVNAKIIGIVGKEDGYTANFADSIIVIPTVDKDLITPHTESFQAVIWHLIVSHPLLAINKNKWESIE